MRTLLTLALVAPLLGCGDDQADVDFGGDDLGEDRYAVLGEDGTVKLGLTREYLYFALSDSVRAEAQAEMEQQSEQEGASGFFGSVVEKTVGRALGFRARYPVSEIRDIRWENGELRIEFVDPDRRWTDDLEIDERPVAEAFTEESVRELAREFRRLKEERGEPAAPAASGTSDGATGA